MLNIIREKKRSIIGFILVGFMAMMMMTFGLNSYNRASRGANATVITVNGHDVTHDEYYNTYQGLVNKLREQFGARFSDFRGMLNLEQRAVDQIIDQRLIDDFISDLGLSASSMLIREKLMSLPQFRQTGLTARSYDTFLRLQRMSAQRFEAALGHDIIAAQLSALVSDLNLPSERELKNAYVDENTTVEVRYLSFDATDFEPKVDVADEAKLKAYYDDHSDKYQRPKTVRYRYAKFEPSRYEPKVDVDVDDLREAYSRREKEFFEPEQLLLRRIVFEKESQSALGKVMGADRQGGDSGTEAANAKKLEAAKQALARLKAGEDFQKVATEVSEDKETAPKGGDIGWVPDTQLTQAAKRALRDLSAGQFSDVIDAHERYEIYYVMDNKPGRQKPFDEVKAQLDADLRRVNAPEYARVEADNFLHEWKKGEAEPLAQAAPKAQLTVADTGHLMALDEDPTEAPDLTRHAIAFAAGDREVVEVNGTAYAIEIAEAKEAFVPDLAEVKERVIADYKHDNSLVLAKEGASSALAALKQQGNTQKTLDDVAKASGAQVKTAQPTSRATPSKDEVTSAPDSQRIIFALNDQHPVAQEILEGTRKYFVVALAKRTPPDESKFSESRSALVQKLRDAAGQRMDTAVLEALKATAKIWVEPTLIDQTSGA